MDEYASLSSGNSVASNELKIAMYAASKAAQEKFSEGLRLELRPFGVKVLSVLAGAVASNIAARSHHFELGEGSFYKATEKESTRQSEGKNQFSEMPTDVFANKVVSDAINGVTGRVWRGRMATFVWFLTRWVPQFMVVGALCLIRSSL